MNGFIIPNKSDLLAIGVSERQAEFQATPDALDSQILAMGAGGTGVVLGVRVTAQLVPDMTVAVGGGAVQVRGFSTAPVVAASLSIQPAHPTLDRSDLVIADATGALSVVTGTAGAGQFPTTPDDTVVLAAIYVPAEADSIVPVDVVDKRVFVIIGVEYVTPEMFGAKGDGVAIDLPAVNAAAAVVPLGGVLRGLPGKAYAIDAPFVPPREMRIELTGATLIQTVEKVGSVGVRAIASTVAITVTGGTVQGQTTTSGAAVTSQQAIYVKGAVGAQLDGVEVRDVTVTGFTFAIWLQDVTRAGVFSNHVTDFRGEGVTLINAQVFAVDHNVIDGFLGIDNGRAYYAITATRDGNTEDLVTGPLSTDGTITYNSADGVRWYVGIDTHAGQRISFIGNRVKNCKYAIQATSTRPKSSSTYLWAPKDILMLLNTAWSDDGSCEMGLRFIGAGSDTGAGSTTDFATGRIMANIVTGCGQDSTNGTINGETGGIVLIGTFKVEVSGNDVNEPAVNGINLKYDNLYASVVSNTITDVWANNSPVCYAIANRSNNNIKFFVSANRVVRGSKSATLVNNVGLQMRPDTDIYPTSIMFGAPNDLDACVTPISVTSITIFRGTVIGLVDIQPFKTPGTYTWQQPSPGAWTYFYAIPGGGGGASGGTAAPGAVARGGPGGGGGGLSIRRYRTSKLPTSVTVTVGDGGAPGASVSADSTAGNSGVQGAATFFGNSVGSALCWAGGGFGGNAATGVGGAGGTGTHFGGVGASSDASGGNGGSIVATGQSDGPGGGGAGGGINAANAEGSGSNGGRPASIGGVTAPQGGAPGVAGPNGTAHGPAITDDDESPAGGCGAAGGGARAAGGMGFAGSGGGGGGGSRNGTPSGAGGKGGAGRAVAVTFP